MPTLGRWLTPDPKGFEDGMNLYAYVHNAPLTHFDEYGLMDFGQYDPGYRERSDLFQKAAIHEMGSMVFDTGRFVAGAGHTFLSAPYNLERGFNYLTGRENQYFHSFENAPARWINQSENWLHNKVQVDTSNPVYNNYRQGLFAGSLLMGNAASLSRGINFGKNVFSLARSCKKAEGPLQVLSKLKNTRLPSKAVLDSPLSGFSSRQAFLLKEHLRQFERYGLSHVRYLQNGRIRYYGKITSAREPGEMFGRRIVREWNSNENLYRTWNETLDWNLKVRQVRPQLDAKNKKHFLFDAPGKFIKEW